MPRIKRLHKSHGQSLSNFHPSNDKMSRVLPDEPETYSLFGESLRKAPPNEEAVKTQNKLYEEALKDYKKDPEDPDNIIWMGRRTAYLDRAFARGGETVDQSRA